MVVVVWSMVVVRVTLDTFAARVIIRMNNSCHCAQRFKEASEAEANGLKYS